jgi:hypothetical protein
MSKAVLHMLILYPAWVLIGVGIRSERLLGYAA